jgi:hypothetical protein
LTKQEMPMTRVSRTLALTVCLFGGCTRMASPSSSADLAATADLAQPSDPVDADLGGSCPAPASANASIDGRLPDGAFSGRFAWVGYRGGDCAELPMVQVAESAAPPAPNAPQLAIYWPSPPVLGDQPVTVLVVDPSGTLEVNGRVTLTVAEPADSSAAVRLAGTLAVNELGGKLSLTGNFSAAHCALLDTACV